MGDSDANNPGTGCPWSLENSTQISGVNHTSPQSFPDILLKATYPIFLLICTIGNILTLIVLPSGKSTSSTNVFLLCMAAADLVILWLNMDNYLLVLDADLIHGRGRFAELYWHVFPVLIWLRGTAVQFCDWTLVAFSVMRVLCISWPLKYRDCGRVKVIRIELILLLATLAINVQSLVYGVLITNAANPPSADVECFLENWKTTQHHAEVFMTLIKWFAIVFINSTIAYKLSTHHKTLQEEHQDDEAMQALSLRRTSFLASSSCNKTASNRILLGSAVLYSVTQFPWLIIRCVAVASEPPFCAFQFRDKIAVYTVGNVFLLVNYSFNFVVYCMSSKKYRLQLLDLRRRASWQTTRTASTAISMRSM